MDKQETRNQMPPEQGKRDIRRPRHDLIPLEFLDELASIFEEGRRPRPGLPNGYGDSWKKGGPDFLRDCLNHASNHLFKYMNGDFSENQLAKVAWNCLVVRYFDLKGQRENQTNKDNKDTTRSDSGSPQAEPVQQRAVHEDVPIGKGPYKKSDY